LPISSNSTQPLTRSRTTIHWPINSLINSKRRRCCCAAWGKYGGHTRYWLLSNPNPYLLRYSIWWPTDPYLYSQSCEILRLGPNAFI
jgi:hypothetical protein